MMWVQMVTISFVNISLPPCIGTCIGSQAALYNRAWIVMHWCMVQHGVKCT